MGSCETEGISSAPPDEASGGLRVIGRMVYSGSRFFLPQPEFCVLHPRICGLLKPHGKQSLWNTGERLAFESDLLSNGKICETELKGSMSK